MLIFFCARVVMLYGPRCFSLILAFILCATHIEHPRYCYSKAFLCTPFFRVNTNYCTCKAAMPTRQMLALSGAKALEPEKAPLKTDQLYTAFRAGWNSCVKFQPEYRSATGISSQ